MAGSSRKRKRKATNAQTPTRTQPVGSKTNVDEPRVDQASDCAGTGNSAKPTSENSVTIGNSTTIDKATTELIESLQAQIAEVSNVRASLVERVAEVEAAANKQVQATETLGEANTQLTATLAEIKDEQAKLDHKRDELDEFQQELASRECEVSRLEGEIDSSRERLQQETTQFEQDRERLDAKAGKTATQRRLIARQLRDHRGQIAQEIEPSLDVTEVTELTSELESASEKIELLEHELARVREVNNDLDSADRDAMNDIRAELDAANEEAQELRIQNQDLAARIAEGQVAGAGYSGQIASESMTWEQRKESMLRQLNAEETGDSTDDDPARRMEINEILERTDREVARREDEIAELRCLLAEQSGAMGDVAVGGAAVLQMLDQDTLIAEERAKLQRIQAEWEDKLRQAEIDVSLERARLARERIELEQRVADLQHSTQVEEESGTKGRKWLARLGLAEDE